MAWDADTQTMSAVRAAEPRYVEGEYVRLTSLNVAWDSDTKELSGMVKVENIHSSVSLNSPQASIISYDPSDQGITDDGSWSHGVRLDPGWYNIQWWTFTDPNGVDFTFTVRVSFTL
ncbi:MAG: hypothetical protein PVH68_02540 [Armatimonadota bacterium]